MTVYKSLAFFGFPNYRVGNDGSVWSYRSYDTKGFGRRWRWRQIKESKNTRYPLVNLCHKGNIKSYSVHRLVLEAFVGPCPEGMEARHFPDRDTYNNHTTNLSWATPMTNQNDRIAHNTHNKGSRAGSAKLNDEKVLRLRKLRLKGHTLKYLSEMFGVSIPTVHLIVSNKTWRHL